MTDHPTTEQPTGQPTVLGGDVRPCASYTLRVNGFERPVTDAWIGESLLYVLRERLGLAGAKGGCEQGECGACSVQVDGQLVAGCLVPAALAADSEIATVEGLSEAGGPSDVQRALAESGAVQCGYCTPGLAMAVHDLLQRNHRPSDVEARQALCGNLCRCTGYRGVLAAVQTVADQREAELEAEAESAAQAGSEPQTPAQQPPPAATQSAADLPLAGELPLYADSELWVEAEQFQPDRPTAVGTGVYSTTHHNGGYETGGHPQAPDPADYETGSYPVVPPQPTGYDTGYHPAPGHEPTPAHGTAHDGPGHDTTPAHGTPYLPTPPHGTGHPAPGYRPAGYPDYPDYPAPGFEPGAYDPGAFEAGGYEGTVYENPAYDGSGYDGTTPAHGILLPEDRNA
ncbi:(2Fe-2S)-binding protein [Kitasatospora sp. NBC_00374]|uniref:(2Fe-2S)-binding protein n=1 Tax=Kitasatospora sp. NBC_00374 TaxID=2975964 RepID=UPI00352EA242